MRDHDFLILNYPQFSERVTSLHQRMVESPAFCELTIQNPIGIVQSVLGPDQTELSAVRLNASNRLLFSLLSNQRFMQWSDEFRIKFVDRATQKYPEETEEEAVKMLTVTVNAAELYNEIANAAVEFVDPEMLFSLIVMNSDGGDGLPMNLGSLLRTSPGGETERMPVLIFAIIAVVVAAVVSVVAFWGRPVVEELSREDLRTVADMVVARLSERADELRASGALTSIETSRRGPGL